MHSETQDMSKASIWFSIGRVIGRKSGPKPRFLPHTQYSQGTGRNKPLAVIPRPKPVVLQISNQTSINQFFWPNNLRFLKCSSIVLVGGYSVILYICTYSFR